MKSDGLKPKAQFKISDNFKITGRGLCLSLGTDFFFIIGCQQSTGLW